MDLHIENVIIGTVNDVFVMMCSITKFTVPVFAVVDV